MILDINLKQSNCTTINLGLRSNEEKQTMVSLNLKTCEIIFDRSNADGWSQGVCHTVIRDSGNDKLQVRLFSDTSSLEIYTDGNENSGYKTVLSGNIYPDATCNESWIESIDGDLIIDRIQTIEIETVW